MSEPTTPTKVIFRIESKPSARFPDAVAFFPEEPNSCLDDYTVTCFAPMGGHSGAQFSYYSTTRPPRTESELAAVAELREILTERYEYTLDERQKWTRQMDETRRAAWQQMIRRG